MKITQMIFPTQLLYCNCPPYIPIHYSYPSQMYVDMCAADVHS